jgi:capsular polysaccharide biosynthesis protein
MTIDEALHRVVRSHWLLILVCVILPVIGSVAWVNRQAPEYEAVGRVQMGTDLAASNVEADAMSERALGIATSPGVVGIALGKAGIVEDPNTFADQHITVRRVGVSPVLEIAVTDESPAAAAEVAKSITGDVISFNNQAGRQEAATRQKQLQKQISDLDKQRKSLIPKLTTASPGDVLAIQAQLTGLMTSETEYSRQLADLDLSASASHPAVLLDPVRKPVTPLPSEVAQQAALAGIVGLFIGLGLASLRESVRPSLRSPRAIAYTLDAGHLGEIPSTDLETLESRMALGQLADRVALLGRARGAWKVFLVPVLDQDDVLANLIARRLLPRTGDTAHRMDCAVLDANWVEPGPHPAAVLLTRRRVRARTLKRATDLLDSLGWPILGFVTCDPRKDLPRPGHAGAARHRVLVNARTAHANHAPFGPAVVGRHAAATAAPAASSMATEEAPTPAVEHHGADAPADAPAETPAGMPVATSLGTTAGAPAGSAGSNGRTGFRP